MLVKECMTKNVELVNPETSIQEAAQKMRKGDFGSLPVEENDRLVGMITDRDIVIRAVAEGKNPAETPVRSVMSKNVLYFYEDQSIAEVTRNMGDNQVRRLPIINRQKRLVGFLSLGDIVTTAEGCESATDALGQISEKKKNSSVEMTF